MIKAIHKPTGKLVSAFKVTTDASWIGTEKDEWIAPKPQIGNWKFLKEKDIGEVPVSFVKAHKRTINNEIIGVVAHFRINCEYAVENPLNESEEHKLAKEGIYELLINNEIYIHGKRISSLGEIEDIDIEHRISKSQRTKIADVILIFKEPHPLYGKGIVFEIQFSYQKEELIQERTYDRVLEGYSVCWLFNGAFSNENELINKNLNITPFSKALNDYKVLETEKIISQQREFAQAFDDKILNLNTQLNNLEFLFNNKTEKTVDFIMDKRKEIKGLFKEGYNKLEENSTELVRNALEQINKEVENKKKEILHNPQLIQEVISKVDMDYIKKQIQEELKYSIPLELKEEIIKSIQNLASQALINKINELDIQKIQEEAYHAFKQEVIPEIKKQLQFIEGYISFKCPFCKNTRRVEGSKLFEGKIMCGTCFQERKNLTEQSWYKREVINGEKPVY